MRVTGSALKGRLLVRTGNKPNADSQAGLYVNSQFPVAAGGYGRITRESPCIAAYASGTPANGEVWGAASASWYLTSGKRGWLVDGAANATRSIVPVQRVSEVGGTPCYAARTTGTSSNIVLESSGLYGDRWKIKIDSTIHRRPDDATVFSLDATNYEVTIAQTGFYAFGGWVKVQHDNDDSQRRVWLEEADSGAYDVDATWTEVYGTTDYMNLGLHAGRENAVCTFYVEHLLSTSKKYRIGVAGGYSADPTTVTACEGRLNVHKFRDL